MLTALRNDSSEKVLARVSERVNAHYVCPRCQCEVVLRKGNIKVHHFAHKPTVTCALGAGESEQHLKAKLAIFDALRGETGIEDLELERDFKISVADVYARIKGVQVAIELQRSSLTVNEITKRTENYHRLGVAVIWVGLKAPERNTEKYSPQAWEKWCHAVYFGRVYYHNQGQSIQPVHFTDYKIYVEESTWYESGSEQSAGGYYKRSKRWRTPSLGMPMLLATHFQISVREAWAKGSVVIPNCTLYMDRQLKWWKDTIRNTG